MNRLLLLSLALLPLACEAVGSAGNLVVAIDMSSLTGPQAKGDDHIIDETGLALLERFPIYFVLRVDADDLDQPVVATWPQEVLEEIPETVTIDLEVRAGEDREVSLYLLAIEEYATAFTYVVPAPGSSPPTVDIAAGQETPMELLLTELPRGTVEASWDTSLSVASVSWVDDQAGVALPPTPSVGDRASTELSVGRIYWPRIALESGELIDLDYLPVSLAIEGELQQVVLDLIGQSPPKRGRSTSAWDR